MVVGHHLVWTAYGWWLPNDPRGSSSREIRAPQIAKLGEPHYGRKPIQPSTEELREFYQRARVVLAHPVLTFPEDEVAILADSFRQTIRQRRYTCYACAVMPEHVHMLIRIHRDKAEQMQALFQDASRDALIAANHRRGNHPVWGRPRMEGVSVYSNRYGAYRPLHQKQPRRTRPAATTLGFRYPLQRLAPSRRKTVISHNPPLFPFASISLAGSRSLPHPFAYTPTPCSTASCTPQLSMSDAKPKRSPRSP